MASKVIPPQPGTEPSTTSGAIGTKRITTVTFHGRDPDTVASSALCARTPTKCQARTRLYRGGKLAAEGFPPQDISESLAGDESAFVWLDLRNPSHDDLALLSEEFGLHPLAIEDAVVPHERPKLDRYETHLFLTAYGARLEVTSGELRVSEIAAFVTRRALITIRKDDGLDVEAIVNHWDASPDLAAAGVGFLLHGLLDYIVDGHFEAVRTLDDAVESLEDQLFDEDSKVLVVQRRSYQLRKSLVLLRRLVLPMREVVNALMRPDMHLMNDELMPYYHDVYDHVLRAAEWTDSLRDLVSSILETNLTIQGNRMNVISKKVTGWAAIIAVPTFITGFYGMNVPYPYFGREIGFSVSICLMVVSMIILYRVFRTRDWL
ncbi:MAG TPA: magnesium transporter CorA family protein [Trebonia sp.]|nr:magnesium transporter CorA family protein [Trebonia sp.]